VALAVRKGPWKLIPDAGKKKKDVAGPQLFNLADDLAETKNLAAEKPEVVKELSVLLAKVREEPRSRP
jgi:arylsulfatase A